MSLAARTPRVDADSSADRVLDFMHSAGGAFRRLRTLLDGQLQTFGLASGECLILWLCATRAHHAGWAQQDLASAIGVSPAQMSSLVEGLRKRGLMEMKRSPVDRRRQVWRLLSQGEDLLEQIRASLGGIAGEMDALVPASGQHEAREVLARLSDPLPIETSLLRRFDPDGPAREEDTLEHEQGGGN